MNTLDLDLFFPKDKIELTKIEQAKETIHIYLKSKTKSCVCPKCGQATKEYHGTYVRHVQDLPILGKNVQLHIKAHEYKCTNTACNASTIAENFNGFLNYYSRMTERCADFICSLALETSCEGCSRICKVLGIKISGDTVIRLLLKRYQAVKHDFTGDKIGIDDFAYKKRHTYGTIIVDEETHNPITLLDGRDGDALRKWLKNNKHIKVITRDRASAYAKVIAEELPDAVQVVDRFHLHQNLLEAIKKALNQELPATIKIPHNDEPEDNHDTSKKIAQNVDNSSNYSEKRYKMICQIQQLLKEGCSYREIACRMGAGRNTIAKYRTGDPKELSMYIMQQSKLDIFHNFILECLYSGKSKSKTVKAVYANGYTCSKSNAFDYLVKMEQRGGKTFEPQPYIRTQTEALKYRMGSKGKTADYITREGVFKHMWMDVSLTDLHKSYIYRQFPNLWELHICIREFRNIFKKKMVVLLYLFIAKYKKSKLKELRSFAKGLENDLNAVENVVAYDYSNGFVEGTNSRLKMIKRTMYGKCNKELLEAKLRYMRQMKNG